MKINSKQPTFSKKNSFGSELISHSESPLKNKKFEISINKPITTDNSPKKLSSNSSSPTKRSKINTQNTEHDDTIYTDTLYPPQARRYIKSLTEPFDFKNKIKSSVKPVIERTLSLTKNHSSSHLPNICTTNYNYGFGNSNFGDMSNSSNKLNNNNNTNNSLTHTLSSNNITNLSGLSNSSSSKKLITTEMMLNR